MLIRPAQSTLPLLLLLTGLLAPLAAQASGIEQFKTFIATTHSARANFNQSVASKSGRKPQQSQGTLAFARPGKFRWTYDKPYYQLLVGDGEKLWIHDKDLNQVTVKKLGQALGSTPAALLAGDAAVEKHFKLVDGGSSNGLELVEATPRSADSTFESVRIGFSDNLPRIMIVVDHFGQTTTLNFSQFERNPPLAGNLFHFTPPKGADVIGE